MENESISFVIPGKAVGKGRPRFARQGAFTVKYTPEKTASYENLVKVKAQEAMLDKPLFNGPLYVEIALLITPPESWSDKKKRAALSGDILPTTKPDIDNIAKTILDACNGVVWIDDKQVCDLRLQKRYSHVSNAYVMAKKI